MTNSGSPSVAVGQYVRFDVVVVNRGESPARKIVVNDRFAEGLWHEQDAGDHSIKYEGIRDLGPGESQSVALTFRVDRAGQLCHELTVTADNATATTPQTGCVVGRAVSLGVTLRGPVRQFVGETAEFQIVVSNGETAATNVTVVQQFPPAMQANPDTGQERLVDGSLRFTINSLAPNERRTFRTQARCIERSASACSQALVGTASGQPQSSEAACVEIVAPMP